MIRFVAIRKVYHKIHMNLPSLKSPCVEFQHVTPFAEQVLYKKGLLYLYLKLNN